MTGTPTVHLAANNAEIGGGEVMLLHVADALRDLGIEARVLAQHAPGGVLEQAASAGHSVTDLGGSGRLAAMRSLARWRRAHPDAALWCHGLAPSLATAGSPGRLVHLHQIPQGRQRSAVALARIGATAVLAPSHVAAARIPGSRTLWNWTRDLPERERHAPPEDGSELRIGYLGRLTAAKGVAVLARAVDLLRERGERPVRLVLGGEERFAGAQDRAELDRALAPIAPVTEHAGWVTPGEFLPGLDLAVFPSVQEESFGLVAAEAMAVGVPFVVTDAGALSEVAGGAAAGIARRGDAGSLAGVISAALARPPGDVAARVHAGRIRWEREFSPEAGRRRVAALLASLAPATGTRR